MIISIASGKGGTGKTLVATSLALSLKDRERIQFLDCDVEEPNAYIFLKPDIYKRESVNIPVPVVDDNKCNYCGKCAVVCAYNAIAVASRHILVFPNICHGCGACAYLCPENAIRENGREAGIVESGNSDGIDFIHGKLTVGEAMAPPVIRSVRKLANYNSIAIIDVPPGTSCPMVEAVKGSDFCLLVTEPTPFGLNDLALAMGTIDELDIPYGVVINRTCGNYDEITDFIESKNVPVLLTIPLDMEIARLYSRGITLTEGIPEWKAEFSELFERIREIVNERAGCVKR
ncbi:ATP-binding protein [Chloroflexota bacterium]